MSRFDKQSAYQQTLHFKQKVEEIIAQTRVDVRAVDWRSEVPQILWDALSHIERCTKELRSEADESPEEYEHQCRLLELQGLLMQARGVFLDEQARQVFSPK